MSRNGRPAAIFLLRGPEKSAPSPACEESIVSRALARPAMQRRAASLARAHAANTQGSAPHGDQVSIDPSVTAGSSSCVAQNFDHVDGERRQVFASTASMAVQSSVRTAMDAAAAETLADSDSGSFTALAPSASSPLARANADGSTRSADGDDDNNRTIFRESQPDADARRA